MSDFSLQDIESLLSEIEAAGGNTISTQRRSPQAPAARPASTAATAGEVSVSPSRISFSTYSQSPDSRSSGNFFSSPVETATGAAASGSPQQRLAVASVRLAPLGPSLIKPSAAFAPKQVLGENDFMTRGQGRGTAAGATAVGASTTTVETALPARREPNFLPVMHARFAEGISGITPKPRWGHSLTSVAGSMLMFGGALAGEGSATNDFFELNASSSTANSNSSSNNISCAIARWEPAFTAKGVLPVARFLHGAGSYLDKFLVIVGGCGTNYASPMGDVHLYDTVTQTWTSAPAPQRNEPSGRFGHTVAIHGDAAYVFGGKCVKKSALSSDGGATQDVVKASNISSDLYVLKLNTLTWKKRLREHADDDAPPDNTAAATAASGVGSRQWPPRRFCHAAVMHRGEMLVHGGEGLQGQTLGDTWAFNVNSKAWRRIHGGQSHDSVPRSRHALFACGEALLAVGGCLLHVPPNKNETFLSVLPLPPQQLPHAATTSAVASEDSSLEFGTHWHAVSLASGGMLLPSKRLFGASMHRGFAYVFGGVAGADGASNHLVQFLASDGFQPTRWGGGGVVIKSQMLRLREKSRPYEDMVLCIRGQNMGVHKFVLQLRAPKLLEDILRCRSDSGDGSGAAPVYHLTGNSRVRGLEVTSVTSEQLAALLAYLYAGSIPDIDNEALVAGLRSIALGYSIQHLTDALSLADETSMAEAADLELARDLETMLSSGLGANATILFVDPHTERQVVHSANTVILMNASELFHQLLKPIVAVASGGGDAKQQQQQSHVVRGITATLGRSASSKRGIIIGPVPIPSLAVRHVLRFIYTAELDVPPEAAFPTMMAAYTLRLPRLQGFCESIIAREEVNFHTCCDFLSLAMTYQAPMLEELSLLTAGVGYAEVSKSQSYQNLDAINKQRIDKIGMELRGHWVAPAAPVTEHKSPSAYASRMQSASQ